MNRLDLQQLAETRLADAKALLQAGQYDGAYYMAGYAVECALKACIAKRTQQHDFPPFDASKSYTHNLSELVKICGFADVVGKERLEKIKSSRNAPPLTATEINWLTVYVWNVERRYELKAPRTEAEELILAIEEPKDGVLQWLRLRW